MMICSSCSVFHRAGRTDSEVATNEVKAPKNKKNKHKKDRKEAPRTPDGERPSDEELGGGQWQITGVGNTKIAEDENMPYFFFEPAKGRFYASDGCNIINGDYVLRSDGKLSFAHTATTMKLCPDIPYADAIAACINDNSTYTAETQHLGNETYINLKNNEGKTALTLRRHNMEFLNGNWQVTSISGKPVTNEECNIFIDIAELKVHGNTGCNYFNGTLYIDPTRTNAIDFSNMGVTRMACPDSAQETAMLVALEEAATAIEGKKENSVLILDRKGRQLMTLKRIPLPEQND